MRYMMLIYSREEGSVSPEESQELARGHSAVMSETIARGIFRSADPLAPTSTATTVRVDQEGRAVIMDGPFAETKEQLAGYYILDCEDLDEAISWAARIPTGCQGGRGCVEIRPIRDIAKPPSG